MIYTPSFLAVAIFFLFVGITLGLSFYLGGRAKSSAGYFAAHGQIPWFVNGVAFAGDYLSAASFLGICGMIAFHGYDGFLYSIGYLAGWVVALFVVAEPMKRLGKFTFADALNSRFDSPGIKLAVGLSTLAVSVFYLIPQMVGAGVLVQPLLGLPHWAGVLIVGAVVIIIVVTAGMVSTTWVQFLKGSLLVIFSAVLTVMILQRGFEVDPSTPEAQTVTITPDGSEIINGLPKGKGPGEASLRPVGTVSQLPDGKTRTGPLGLIEFFSTLQKSEVVLWTSSKTTAKDGSVTTTYSPKQTPGSQILRPGEHPKFKGIRGDQFSEKLNFLSLMLALFCGTASLPHILIRYYTVKNEAAARKSTIVGIGCIGFFYVLTLYMGLGAMTSGAMDVTNSNMAAPLLAKSMSELLFAIISAIAFTTVLGTVSGLILASAGAVAHDLVGCFSGIKLTDHEQVRIAKITSVIVGAIAIVLGILFEKLNVSYLVGWAFSVAASANLPSLVMLLFWKGVTKQGIIAAVVVGMTSSLGWILLSADTYSAVYGLPAENALVPFSQPGIVTIPLGFATLVVVSLLSRNKQ
ncbi:sodium/solute symporter [Bythopirellula polymerisocia]|uniref:Cation/acetate symporter ActP n=1 Tax=Bythopirellula polymerisocia TaxID=2528003 RepID=A0A5C6CQH3_9BACT|nr:cation acetate symporter [Bythopirellula polymerisocia]TWU25681.1 Cation/acetate symporter ActP [Bythopirellula polymerisocia]